MCPKLDQLAPVISEVRITLFLYRNDCSTHNRMSSDRCYLATIPIFTPAHISRLQECRQNPINLRSFFSEIAYEVPYNSSRVQQLLGEGSFEQKVSKDFLLAVLTF
jgi:hypothetical protein